jgi:hypothetical protein
MKILSYLLYIIAWEVLVVGGIGYAVFTLEQSGWWFLLAALLSASAYPPERWSALWDDNIAEKYRAAKLSHEAETE